MPNIYFLLVFQMSLKFYIKFLATKQEPASDMLEETEEKPKEETSMEVEPETEIKSREETSEIKPNEETSMEVEQETGINEHKAGVEEQVDSGAISDTSFSVPDQPFNESQLSESMEETKMDVDQISNPPDPASCPPEVPLTIEDKIKMDTSLALHSVENESLDVHVDDTQNDLDSDLVSDTKSDTASVKREDVTLAPSGNEESQSVQSQGESQALQPKEDSQAVQVKEEESKETKETVKEEVKVEEVKAESSVKVEKTTPEKIATLTPETIKTDPIKQETESLQQDTKVEKVEDKDKIPAEKKEDTSKPVTSTTTPVKSATAAKDTKKDEKSTSGRNLWVSGLSSTTRATDLKALFSKHGKVVGAKVVTNARSPGSKCYGFVTMSTPDEATKCIQHLHRTELHGKMISVERAKSEPNAQARFTPAVGAAVKKPEVKTPLDKKAPPKKDEKDHKEMEKKEEQKPEEKKDDKTPVKTDVKADDKKHTPGQHREVSHKTTPDSADKARTVVMDKSKGEPVVRVERDRSRGASATSSHSKSKAETKREGPAKDTLSFDKIQEERERERLRQRERRLREEERVKRQQLERERRRQREVQMKQRQEAIRLAREREKLRIERENLEREKIEAAHAEKLRMERMERERIEREREERQRLEQLRQEQEQVRRALKRTYEARGAREDYNNFQSKRANIDNRDNRDKRYNENQAYQQNRYDDRDRERVQRDSRDTRDNRDNRYNDRNAGDGFERKVERYDRRDNRQDNRQVDVRQADADRHDRGGRQFDGGRRDSREFRENQRDERRNDERFDRYDRGGADNRGGDRGAVRDDRREDYRDRVRDDRQERGRDDRRPVQDNRRDERSMQSGGNVRGSPPRHDNREWKSERDNRPQSDSRVVVRGQSNVQGGGRGDNWQGGSGHGGGGGGGHQNYGNQIQDDRNRNKQFTHTVSQGASQTNQNRSWGAGTDNRGKMEGTWQSHGSMETRIVPQQQDRWPASVSIQQDSRQNFAQTVPAGLIASVTPNVYMTSVPQQPGMIIAGPAIAATNRQQEARFDAYKSMQPTTIRRF